MERSPAKRLPPRAMRIRHQVIPALRGTDRRLPGVSFFPRPPMEAGLVSESLRLASFTLDLFTRTATDPAEAVGLEGKLAPLV